MPREREERPQKPTSRPPVAPKVNFRVPAAAEYLFLLLRPFPTFPLSSFLFFFSSLSLEIDGSTDRRDEKRYRIDAPFERRLFSLGLVIDSKKGSEGGEGETVVFFRLNKRPCFFVWEEKKTVQKTSTFLADEAYWWTLYFFLQGNRIDFVDVPPSFYRVRRKHVHRVGRSMITGSQEAMFFFL